mgnify:CR=1 FL=1
MSTFKALGLNDAILQAVTDMGFTAPSEVQEKAIPVLLREETDVVALAQTGTGKTAAFGFPLTWFTDHKRTKKLLKPRKRLEHSCRLRWCKHSRAGAPDKSRCSDYCCDSGTYAGYDATQYG